MLSLKQDEIVFAVRRSCEMKADIVAKDETETGIRALLNLGHTFAHAIEVKNNYSSKITHGDRESVEYGKSVEIGGCVIIKNI